MPHSPTLALGNTQQRALPSLAGFCLILSAIEHLIPKPLPFLRLGLANLPLLLGLELLAGPQWFALASLKLAAGALISGSLLSWTFIFSLGGTLVSSLTMFLLFRLFTAKRMSYFGISLAGAMAFNMAQLFIAQVFIFKDSARFMAPLVLASGLISGSLLGLFALYFASRSQWFAQAQKAAPSLPAAPEASKAAQDLQAPSLPAAPEASKAAQDLQAPKALNTALSLLLLLASLGIAVLYTTNSNLLYKCILFALFYLGLHLNKRRASLLRILLATAGICFFSLLIPFGEILFSIGPLPITLGALTLGLDRALTIEGLLLLSRAVLPPNLPDLLSGKGRFSSLLAESLEVYERLTIAHSREKFNPRKPVESIDALLLRPSGRAFRQSRRASFPKKPLVFAFFGLILSLFLKFF